MLTLYICGAILGGILIGASAFIGGHDADHDVDHDVDHSLDHGHDHDVHGDFWLPFLSLRFWTYGLMVFGVVGLLLTWLTNVSTASGAVLSIASGLVAGTGVAYLMRSLRGSDSDSLAREQDLLGVEAKVLVPIRGETSGKVRVNVKGELIDLVASTTEETPLDVGDSVLVVGIDGGKASVIRRETFFGEKE
jgi:membrane protein implicated in regulation of membrane protease activity